MLTPTDGMEEEDRLYEQVKARRGKVAAGAISELRSHLGPVPTKRAWEWAEEKYDERLRATEAATGYDPEEEYRSHRSDR